MSPKDKKITADAVIFKERSKRKCVPAFTLFYNAAGWKGEREGLYSAEGATEYPLRMKEETCHI